MSVPARIAVFTDFDDTLTTQNVAQFLLRRFAPEAFAENSTRYRNGDITFREYQERSFNAVTSPVSEMQAAAADEIEMREGIPELADAVAAAGGTFTVASAGLRFYIDPVLRRHGLGHLPVVCGTASRDDVSFSHGAGRDAGPGNGPFRYDYPFSAADGADGKPCRGDWATCKCKALGQAGDGVTTIFVGDGGTSDASVAPRADHVFARDRLLNICQEIGVDAAPFEDLRPVAAFVRKLRNAPLARSEQT
ncbi:MAG: HAD-IB family phosphatase [Chloroflexi bacterium]|nr:HAD-IB family phosphatase [Chloroflexota bacterium]